MSEQATTVECATHGTSRATYVCQHLTTGADKGFYCGYDPQEPDECWPDAWCDECEKTLESEGEWNEASAAKADIQVVCHSCYEGLREKHWRQDEENFKDLISSSNRYLKKKQDKFLGYYKINKHEHWDCFQETGKLVFTHKGVDQIEAWVSYSGSYSNDSKSWLWAWADESLVEPIKQKSRQIRELGKRKNYLKLSSARWPTDEAGAWEMTALMAKELKAKGVYRISNETGFNYMIVHQAHWLSPKDKPSIIQSIINKIK